MSEQQHLERLAEWCQEVGAQPLVIGFGRFSLFATVSALQLARRHPGVSGAVGEAIDDVIRNMQGLMPQDICEISLLGSDTANDVYPEDDSCDV